MQKRYAWKKNISQFGPIYIKNNVPMYARLGQELINMECSQRNVLLLKYSCQCSVYLIKSNVLMKCINKPSFANMINTFDACRMQKYTPDQVFILTT